MTCSASQYKHLLETTLTLMFKKQQPVLPLLAAGALGIPFIYGIPFGHVPHQATFPYGIQAELDTGKGTLRLLEVGVV